MMVLKVSCVKIDQALLYIFVWSCLMYQVSTLACYQSACAGCKEGDRRTRPRSTADCSNAPRADLNWIVHDRVVGNKFSRIPERPMCIFFYSKVGERFTVVRGCVGDLDEASLACENLKAHVRSLSNFQYVRCNICRGDLCNSSNRLILHYLLLYIAFGILCLL